jgi:rhamnosyltransferase
VTNNDVCAVSVTFHPSKEVFQNLDQVCRQFKQLVVVDNGSDNLEFRQLQNASDESGFSVVSNRTNLGIAAALNIGVRRAEEYGFRAVVLFDQDSTISDGFLQSMITAYNAYPHAERVAIVAPRHWDRNANSWLAPQYLKDDTLRVAITSGSMIPLSILSRCGLFAEDYFIDMVDTEYCLRVRRNGFLIICDPDARIVHSVGSLKDHRLGRLKTYRVSHHSPGRRYYMTRNRLATLFRYWRFDRSLCYHIPKSIVMDTVLILIFEDHRFRKLLNTCLGIIDALRGKMGRVIDL